jgi:hypothetical protein
MRKSICRILGIAGLLALAGCTVYASPAPRPVVYYPDGYYYGSNVVVVGGGYYHGGYYRHWR